jgi:iron complex transport system permease protein
VSAASEPASGPVRIGARSRARLGAPRLAVALGLLAAAVVVSTLTGAADLGVARVLAEVRAQLTGGVSPLSEREAAILWQLRLPRVLLAVLVGAALASSGAAFQGVFRNPLADPYLLGAAAGAGLGATVMVAVLPGSQVFDSSASGWWAIGPVPVAAFAGALFGVALSYLLGRTAGRPDSATLVLAGVVVASFLTAVQTFVLQSNTDTLQEVYSWILGSLGTTGWSEVLVVLPYVALSSVVLWGGARLLDVLSVGDEEAAALGVRPALVRLAVVLAASLATAAAVAVSGLIGFFGIVVPHIIRLTVGGSYRVVLPLSLLCGGAFLVAADMIARTALAPAELPIGVVTAFTGAPFFAIVLRSAARGAVR